MPINIPNELPAALALQDENIFVMTQERAEHQDIRPLELLFLNLMPNKIATELQYMRNLSNTPLQVNIDLLRIDSHAPKNTPVEHLETFYKDFSQVCDRHYDGMIVSGAPLDRIDFSDVNYFKSLEKILSWGHEHVTSTLFSCWGVAAAMQIFYSMPLYHRQEKLSGVYLHQRADSHDPLIRGFDDVFYAPQSRFIDFPVEKFEAIDAISVLASSKDTGVYLASSKDMRQVFVTGHPEYDTLTLDSEYRRDIGNGMSIDPPCNYYPHNNPQLPPLCTWRSHGSMLFANWLNYYVYQETPYSFNTQ